MIRQCTSCGQKNRVPSKQLANVGKCGKCKSELAAADAPMDVGVAEFDDIIANAKVPVLVDFWAEWCGPCRMAAPELKKLAKAQAGKSLVLKVNTEQHPQLAQRYQVRGIPNFLVFRAGKLVKQQAGLVPAAEMANWLR